MCIEKRLLIIPYPDEVPGRAERRPRDVEPAGGGQELVGVFTGAKEVNKFRELLRVARANVGGLAKEVLRALDATNEGVDARVAVAGIDDDGADKLAGGFQEHQAALGHVRHVLHGGNVVGILAEIKKLA